MDIWVVSRVYNGEKLAGYCLVTGDFQTSLVAKEQLLEKIQAYTKSGQVKFMNIESNGEQIVGTNGIMKRYPKRTLHGTLLEGSPPSLTVLYRVGDSGYVVSDYKGVCAFKPMSETLQYSEKHGITNGKVVERNFVKFVSSISDEYPEIDADEIRKRLHIPNPKEKNVKIRRDSQEGTYAKNQQQDSLYLTKAKDELAVLTQNHTNAILNYFSWRSVDEFNRFRTNGRVDMSPNKLEKIRHLRSDIEWRYAGMVDAVMKTGKEDRCIFNHAIRYAHYALPMDSPQDIPLDQRTDYIKFGVDCSRDFFEIGEDSYKQFKSQINKLNRMMREETLTIINDLNQINPTEDEPILKQRCSLAHELFERLQKNERAVSILGTNLAKSGYEFNACGLGFPKSFLRIMASKLCEDSEYRRKSDTKLSATLNALYPNMAPIISVITDTDKYCRVLNTARTYFYLALRIYSEGIYMYDPFRETNKERRMLGGYSKSDKSRRRSQLRDCTNVLGCTDFTLTKMNLIMSVLAGLYSIYLPIEAYRKQVGLTLGELAEFYTQYRDKSVDSIERTLLEQVFLTFSGCNLPYTYYKGSLLFTKERDLIDSFETVEKIVTTKESMSKVYEGLITEIKKSKAAEDELLSSNVKEAVDSIKENITTARKNTREKRNNGDFHLVSARIKAEAAEIKAENALFNVLSQALERHIDKQPTTTVKIAESILTQARNRKKNYRDLSEKQKGVIVRALSYFEVIENGYPEDDRIALYAKLYAKNKEEVAKEPRKFKTANSIVKDKVTYEALTTGQRYAIDKAISALEKDNKENEAEVIEI